MKLLEFCLPTTILTNLCPLRPRGIHGFCVSVPSSLIGWQALNITGTYWQYCDPLRAEKPQPLSFKTVSGGEGWDDDNHVIHLFLCKGFVTCPSCKSQVLFCALEVVGHSYVTSQVSVPGQDLKSLHCYLQDGCCHNHLLRQVYKSNCHPYTRSDSSA